MEKVKENTIYEDGDSLYLVEDITTNQDGHLYVIYREIYNLENKIYGDYEAIPLTQFNWTEYKEEEK